MHLVKYKGYNIWLVAKPIHDVCMYMYKHVAMCTE